MSPGFGFGSPAEPGDGGFECGVKLNTSSKKRIPEARIILFYLHSIVSCTFAFLAQAQTSYLQLIRAAGSLLLDARHHALLHLVQSSVERGELRLQVLLDPVGVCLASREGEGTKEDVG